MITQSFIKNFEAEVHIQYQQMGSKLRNTVRTKDNIRGTTTTFSPVGKERAYTLAAVCELHDYFAGDWVVALDELLTNISEQQIVAKASAYALGRHTDELIIAELEQASIVVTNGSTGLTRNKVDAAHSVAQMFSNDGQKFAIVGWKQWSELLGVEEFYNASYVEEDRLPWKGTQAKRWLDTLWIPHSGLPKSGNVRHCFWYHKTAVGHAIGSEVKTDITSHGDRAAHFINNMMSQGACLIDPTLVVQMECVEQ